jgi:putative nucleotidyltransferase with HDIG domain
MKIAMIILAAGFSERMGVLKPLLPVGGESALQRAVSLGRHEKIHSISVVTGHRREEVEAELLRCRAKNVRHIYNARYAEGMFTSVKAGIHSLPNDIDGFLLLPVDHCGVHPDTLEKVIAAFVLSSGQAVVYPTYNGDRGHPPLIPYRFAAGIRDYDGSDGMRGFLAPYPFEEVDIDDRGILLDMDMPRDYEALLTHLGLPTYPDETGCLRLLGTYKPPENVIQHCRQVRDLALRTAELLGEKGVIINKELLSAACLLHDIARQEPAHETAGARLLLTEGYPAAARLVASHMDLPDDYSPEPDETALLYLADKLSRHGKIATLDETLTALRARFADDPDALAHAEKRMARAHAILEMLNKYYGIKYNDIAG